MGYIKDIKIGSTTHLIEPTLYAATAGTASAITAAITNFELQTGVTVFLKITTANSASATLNVSSTGAKAIKYNNAAIAASALKANNFYAFVYDGSAWQLVGELNTNTDVNVTHTLATTTKYYVTGTTSATTSTGGDSFDTGIYATATAGELSAVRHSFNVSGAEKAYMTYNNTNQSIEFVFN